MNESKFTKIFNVCEVIGNMGGVSGIMSACSGDVWGVLCVCVSLFFVLFGGGCFLTRK